MFYFITILVINTYFCNLHRYSTGRSSLGRPVTLLSKIGLSDLLDKWPKDCIPMGGRVGPLTAGTSVLCHCSVTALSLLLEGIRISVRVRVRLVLRLVSVPRSSLSIADPGLSEGYHAAVDDAVSAIVSSLTMASTIPGGLSRPKRSCLLFCFSQKKITEDNNVFAPITILPPPWIILLSIATVCQFQWST